MSIGSRIKQRREELGYTQPKLAKLVGVSKGTIGNYESNISSPNEEILFKLFDVLNCDANFLYQDNIDWNVLGEANPSEKKHIEKYRTLDTYGKEAVDSILDVEYRRCNAKHDIEVKKLEAAARITGGGQRIPETPPESIFQNVVEVDDA